MAQFNPITDLMPMDSSEESVDKSSEQIESIRIQLTQTRDSLSNVVNIIKVKKIILDPVMVSKGGTRLIDYKAIQTLKKKFAKRVSFLKKTQFCICRNTKKM